MAKKAPTVRRLAGTIKRKCKNPRCKKDFEAKNAKGVYCSAECRAQDFYFSKKESEKPNPSVKTVKQVKKVKVAPAAKSAKPKAATVKEEISREVPMEVPASKKIGHNMNFLERRRAAKNNIK